MVMRVLWREEKKSPSKTGFLMIKLVQINSVNGWLDGSHGAELR